MLAAVLLQRRQEETMLAAVLLQRRQWRDDVSSGTATEKTGER